MTKQYSYTKLEKIWFQELKSKLMLSESTEDVKKFFVRVVSEFIRQVSEGQVKPQYEDIWLEPGSGKGYGLSTRLCSDRKFKARWSNSDLPRILGLMAGIAVNKYRHLEKHPDRTELKIFHHPGETS